MQHDVKRSDPGRAAYEARFAHARPRDVEPWDSLPPEVRAIWVHVEAKSRGQVVAPEDVREALTEAIQQGLSESPRWISAEPGQIADELIAGPLANLVASAAESDRWGSEYADAMDARMADAVAFEKLWEALNRATKAMDGVDVFVTTKERIHRPAGEQWWAEEMAAARAALAEPYRQEPRSGDGWPSGCIKPGSCSRHRQCMYARSVEQCRHFGEDLTQAVEAATRDREWAAAERQKGGSSAA